MTDAEGQFKQRDQGWTPSLEHAPSMGVEFNRQCPSLGLAKNDLQRRDADALTLEVFVREEMLQVLTF